MRIAVIEDERPIREGLVHILNKISPEYQVVGSAENGREGLILLEEQDPDLILLDIQMPDMNGLQMLKEARELGIVEISIKEPWERDLDLENKIHQIYGVKAVRVVSAKENSKEQITSRLSEVSAYYLDSVVKEKMVVGISWGNILMRIIRRIFRSQLFRSWGLLM